MKGYIFLFQSGLHLGKKKVEHTHKLTKTRRVSHARFEKTKNHVYNNNTNITMGCPHDK